MPQFIIGILIGVVITALVFQRLLAGTLHIDTSSPDQDDGPFIFLALSKQVCTVASKRYVLLKVQLSRE